MTYKISRDLNILIMLYKTHFKGYNYSLKIIRVNVLLTLMGKWNALILHMFCRNFSFLFILHWKSIALNDFIIVRYIGVYDSSSRLIAKYLYLCETGRTFIVIDVADVAVKSFADRPRYFTRCKRLTFHAHFATA